MLWALFQGSYHGEWKIAQVLGQPQVCGGVSHVHFWREGKVHTYFRGVPAQTLQTAMQAESDAIASARQAARSERYEKNAESFAAKRKAEMQAKLDALNKLV